MSVKTPGGASGVARGVEERKKTSTGGGEGGGGAGVEVKLEEFRAVVVRGAEGGGVPEGGLRRVAFEIGEWVRGLGERELEMEGEREGRRGSGL